MGDFIEQYISYSAETEPQHICHRWSAIATVGALLGRNYYLPFGPFRIYPNIYTMLIGDPGARKSTAIKLIKRLVTASGYDTLGADKTTKEKFLIDLEGLPEEDFTAAGSKYKSKEQVYDAITNANLWGEDNAFKTPKEVFIMADEWNEFAGAGNIDFYTTLGNLWDWDDDIKPFTQRVKNTRSVAIYQPTVSILGGNTPENFARAFPPEIIGQGFMSRMILIHCEKSSRQYTIPPTPAEEVTNEIVSRMQSIRGNIKGPATVSDSGYKILDSIYKGWPPIEDVRFKSYSTRRFTQLLKLCLIVSASADDNIISEEVVIRANTILAAAESTMPRALGEFGKSKNSDVTNKVMDVLNKATKALTIKDIWKHVHNDLDKPMQVAEMMQALQTADKVMYVKDRGYLPRKLVAKKIEFVDFSLLTEEERGGL